MQAQKSPAEAFRHFAEVWDRGMELDRLRRRANHFTTPRWQRPYWRFRVWFMLRRHYRAYI